MLTRVDAKRLKSLVGILFAWVVFSAQTFAPPLLRGLDEFVKDALTEYRIPGLALALVESNKVIYLKGYGIADPTGRPVTPQTPFYLASVTKSFTAMAVLQLVEAGRLELDVPVTNYIPWFSMKDGAAGNQAGDRITLRHLLHHTSGIAQPTGQTALAVNDDKPDALERQVRSFAQVPLNRQPGSLYEYANANYQIAGLAVQKVSGRSIENVFKEQIFKPLAMAHSHTDRAAARADGLATGYRWWFGCPVAFAQKPFPRGHFPSGFCISTAEDLASYLIAQMNSGRYQEAAVLSTKSLAVLHTPGQNSYGMGWYIGQDGIIEHGGQLECFGAHLYMDTKHQRAIALLFNVNRGEGCGHLYQLAPTIARLLAGEAVSRPPVDHGNRALLFKLLGALIGIGIWLGWSLRHYWKWASGIRPGPQGWKLWLWLAVPLLAECLCVTALVESVPVAISVAFLHSPDLMCLWLLAVLVTAGWCLMRTFWGIGLALRAGKRAVVVEGTVSAS
jgi:CubicO group peptidase (beta-lactamase class C family)